MRVYTTIIYLKIQSVKEKKRGEDKEFNRGGRRERREEEKTEV
jgi:hypothetical protein